MERIRVMEGRPFEVGEVVLKNGRRMSNKVVICFGRFIMVEADNEGEPPSMYNVDTVEELLRVNDLKRSVQRFTSL